MIRRDRSAASPVPASGPAPRSLGSGHGPSGLSSRCGGRYYSRGTPRAAEATATPNHHALELTSMPPRRKLSYVIVFSLVTYIVCYLLATQPW